MSSFKQPALFISHGSPMMAVEKSKTSLFLQQLGRKIPRPKAIIVFSAHFDNPQDIVISSARSPKTIHDFYGFPDALYALHYHAPGSPELAEQVAQLFKQQGITPILDSEQGWDHGVWIPLRLIYPQADIPIVTISINSRLGATANYRYGQIVSELREQGVLIIGSGGISHNLREIFNPSQSAESRARVQSFTHWVKNKLLSGDIKALLNYLNEAPEVLFNHPTQEHFLPLLAALGSSDLSAVKQIHEDSEYGMLALDAYQFG